MNHEIKTYPIVVWNTNAIQVALRNTIDVQFLSKASIYKALDNGIQPITWKIVCALVTLSAVAIAARVRRVFIVTSGIVYMLKEMRFI